MNFEFSWNQKTWDSAGQYRRDPPDHRLALWRGAAGASPSIPSWTTAIRVFRGWISCPATRLDYKIDETWTVAAEEYDDFGELRGFAPANQQSHALWGVVDYTGNPISMEAGLGFGLTSATDSLAVKLMLMSDLTGPHGLFAD